MMASSRNSQEMEERNTNNGESRDTNPLGNSNVEKEVKLELEPLSNESIINEAPESTEPSSASSSHPPTHTSSTSYSFSSETLRQRHVPLKEVIQTNKFRINRPSPTTESASDDKGKKKVSNSSPAEEKKAEDPDGDGGYFECNICMDMASNPVVTLCGHLYCWPCIHQWIKSRAPSSNTCPVCKSGIDKQKMIPIYVRGREPKDPREMEDIPDRPSGQRSEAPPNTTFWNFGNNPNFQFNVGVGMFPFFPLGFQIGVGDISAAFAGQRQAGTAAPDPNVQQAQAFIARALFMMAVLTLLTLILY